MIEARIRADLNIVMRIDGRGFSRFTRDLVRPYDARLGDLMVATTTRLVRELGTCAAYTQSDEITLAWHATPDPLFGGRVEKSVSLVASLTTALFASLLPTYLPGKQIPTFDCRVFGVEDLRGPFAARQHDARVNCVNALARHHCGHAAVQGKGQPELLAMIHAAGVSMFDLPHHQRHGLFVETVAVDRVFTPEEIAELPSAHPAHAEPGRNFPIRRQRTTHALIFEPVKDSPARRRADELAG